MISRKLLVTTVLSVVLIAGNAVFAGSDLLKMDVKKASSEDTVDVTFYTTGAPTNTVVTRKSGNTYVVLLPNVAGNQSIVPSLGGVKDLVSDVSVKNVNDGIGGYTKVTFNTTKPVKIQTYTQKTAPLTKAQQDYKNLIAQNSKFDTDKKLENFKKTNASTSSAQKPVSVAAPKKTTTKPVEVKNTTSKSVTKIALKPVTVQAPTIKAETLKSNTQAAKTQAANKVENKPAVDTKVQTKPAEITPAPAFELKNPPAESKNAAKTAKQQKNVKAKTATKDLPIIPIAGALSVIGIFVLGALMNIVVKAVKNNSQLKEYLENYNSESEPSKTEDYNKIADNSNLSWQEKYKLYSQTKDAQNQDDASYVANINGEKGVIVDDMAARVSQMEHALSQTPSMKKFVSAPKGVQSEDDAITRQMSGLNLKSFAKNLDLKMTNRQNLPAENDMTNDPLKEGKHVTLKNTGLTMSRRNIGGHGFSISDLVRTGKRFLPKQNVSDEMKEIQEQYLLSSVEEYLNIIDNENEAITPVQNSAVTEEITNLIPKRNRTDMMSATNPMQKKTPFKKPQASDFNISIKSKYDIDSDKSIYMVESDGISALIGKIGENVYVLKKFDKIVNKPLQVRLDYGSVYIVRVGNFKCLVDVAEDKMGTLLEI